MQMLNLLAASNPGFFYPVRASTIANDVDPLAWFIHIMTIVFTVGIIAVTLWFVVKYRASVHPVALPPGHNNVLEVVWTAIPAVIVFICFFWGFRVYMKMTVHQPASVKIEAIGRQWSWSFQYKNPHGGTPGIDDTLYLPLDTPVEIELSSNDVIHALFLPAMRMKKDVVPGRYNSMLVEPTRLGTYDVYCAEYCGDNHSQMLAKCIVLSKDDYAAKMLEISRPVDPKKPDWQNGEHLASINGCFSCHSVDGKTIIGPTWLDMYGATGHEMADGSTVTVDDAYIMESIRTPNAKVRKGFGPPSAMVPFPAASLPEEYVKYIIAYQKHISKFAPKEEATTAPVGNAAKGATTTSTIEPAKAP